MPNIDIPMGDKKIAELLASTTSESGEAARTLIEYSVTPELVESALPTRLSDVSLSAMILDQAESAISNPETPVAAAVQAIVDGSLAVFTPADVPKQVLIGSNLTIARPTWAGPIYWVTTVVGGFPINAIAGDHIIEVSEESYVAILSDDFNRANGAAGSTPIGAKAWQVDGQAGTTATIASNRLTITGIASSTGNAFVDAGVANGRYKLTIAATGPNHQGAVIFRHVDAANEVILALRTAAADNRYRIMRRVSGTATVMATLTQLSTDGDVIQIDLSGQDVSIRINDVLAWSGPINYHTTATKFGINASSADLSLAVDDVSFGVPA